MTPERRKEIENAYRFSKSVGIDLPIVPELLAEIDRLEAEIKEARSR